jgi:phosphatidylglycerophosphatase C
MTQHYGLPSECCISAESLVARLAAAHHDTDNPLLAFDADGTLWSGDVGNDLFNALVEKNAVRDAAYEALVNEAKSFGVAHQGNATDVARALFAAHVEGAYPEDRAFAMMAWVFAGFSLEEVTQFSKEVVLATQLESRLHRFLDPVFNWAKNKNVAIWIVSASAKWMVEIGVALLGVPNDRVIGMMPQVRNGIIEPALDGPAIYGPNKPVALRAACPNGVLLGGFGDSSYDAPLLAMAKVPVGVRPKSGLVARANDLPNFVAVGF